MCLNSARLFGKPARMDQIKIPKAVITDGHVEIDVVDFRTLINQIIQVNVANDLLKEELNKAKEEIKRLKRSGNE